MRLAIGIMMQLVGYTATATVAALLLGLGYMWRSGQLNNEKLFEISAIVHDINLEELEAVKTSENDEIPPEEPSIDEARKNRTVAIREAELKSEQFRRQTREFNHTWELLAAEMERRDQLAKSLDDRLAQAEANVVTESNANVARHFNLMKEGQVKDELMRMIDDEEMEQVVPLLNQMDDGKLKKVFKKFQTEEEMTRLHEILQLMRQGFPKKDVIDEVRRELQDLKSE